MVNLSLITRKAIGALTRPFFRGWGRCYCCGRPWPVVRDKHYTNFQPRRAMFPLCEECWQELTPTDRLDYHYMLFSDWLKDDCTVAPLWEEIRAAVLKGENDGQ